MISRPLRSALMAECLGSFMLVFAGCGAIVFNDLSGGAISHLGIAASFGLIVLNVIYAFGDISGAHINPAVTIAFAVAKRFSWTNVLPYCSAQIIGAVLAALLLRWFAPTHFTLGSTLPHLPLVQAFVLEALLTWWLMLVILFVASGAKEKGLLAGLVIAAVVALEALFAGPMTGASMNPARSLAPALISGQLNALWLYICAPVLGAIAAVFCFRVLSVRS
jgi:aquaporin Z